MTINVTSDYAKVGYDAGTDTATISKDDTSWMRELIQNIKNATNMEIIREAEHDFHEEMTERYGGKVAGELLLVLWKKCAE